MKIILKHISKVLLKVKAGTKKTPKALFKLIAHILSKSPILCISDDTNFHDIKKSSSKYRYSLISFGLGNRKLYIITYREKFNIWFTLNLDDFFTVDENELENLVKDYEAHIKPLDKESVSNESEFLNYLIVKEEARLNLSYTKINSYITILSIILPLFVAFSTQYIPLITRSHYLIFLILFIIIYSSANVWILIINSYTVRGYSSSTFRELKANSSTKNLSKLYYYDWQNIKKKADLFVSFVLNIRNYFNWLVVAIIIFVLYMLAPQFLKSYEFKNNAKNEYIIKMDNGSLQENDLIQLHNIEKCLIENKIKSMIIDASSIEALSKISSNIDTYSKSEAIIKKVVDSKYPNDQITIKIKWR